MSSTTITRTTNDVSCGNNKEVQLIFFTFNDDGEWQYQNQPISRIPSYLTLPQIFDKKILLDNMESIEVINASSYNHLLDFITFACSNTGIWKGWLVSFFFLNK